MLPATVIAEFWKRVDKRGPDECWPCRGSRNQKGYGQFVHDGKAYTANRVALEIKLGRPIKPDHQSMHQCDHPWCQNDRHLEEGTNEQNAKERVDRGLYARRRKVPRAENPNAKLSDEQVAYILASPLNGPRMAAKFNVARSTINRIRKRAGQRRKR